MPETYGSLLRMGVRLLEAKDISNPGIDAERLLQEVSGKSHSFLFLHQDDECGTRCALRFYQLLERRMDREPLQYIIGSQEFMGLPFQVNPAVLIPRQDTETLVETAIKEASDMEPDLRILDMCCGSGAIAVSCACYIPGSRVTACDFSEEALDVARKNAEANQVSERISFMKSDLFSCFRQRPDVTEKTAFDMILCNPPYIPTDVIPGLQAEITEYEPREALDGGPDGLDFYRVLSAEAWEYLKPGGLLLMEIGSDQAEAVQSLLRQQGRYTDPDVIRDLAGKDRVIRCRRVL